MLETGKQCTPDAVDPPTNPDGTDAITLEGQVGDCWKQNPGL